MSAFQLLVLFWIFVVFFTIIGVVAIFTIVGIIKTEPKFRNWAVGGFAAAILGVVVLWAKTQAPPMPLDLFVNLQPPSEVAAETFELESGTFEYVEQSSSGKPLKRSGNVELTVGQNLGWWRAKIPCLGLSRPFKLILKDKTGRFWTVRPFYPNYHTQPLMAGNPQPNQRVSLSPTLGLIGKAMADDQKPRIKFNNYARPLSSVQGRHYYQWRVFVDEPFPVLNQIAEVQYMLHPTFPYPLQVRNNPNDKFALENSGWGQFTIQITIRFKNGTVQNTQYYLDLTKR